MNQNEGIGIWSRIYSFNFNCLSHFHYPWTKALLYPCGTNDAADDTAMLHNCSMDLQLQSSFIFEYLWYLGQLDLSG